MQERLLPPRSIGFGPYLLWQCRERIADEYDITSQDGDNNRLSKDFNALIVLGETYGMSLTEHHEAILRLWRTILSEYSTFKLSILTDRIIAISGIITVI